MIASVTGPVMAMRADVGYASAKAGMIGLTRAIAVDAARHGITVNAVAPGWIATGSQTAEEHGEGLVTPAGRSGSPDEVAEQMVRLNQRLGVNHIVASVHWPGMPNSLALEQLEILSREVMPQVRRA